MSYQYTPGSGKTFNFAYMWQRSKVGVIATGALLLVLSCCVGLAALGSTIPSPKNATAINATSTPQPSSTKVTLVPTVTLKGTKIATPPSTPVPTSTYKGIGSTTYLGGTFSAFTIAFGFDANSANPITTISGIRVMILLLDTNGSDGKRHIDTITIVPVDRSDQNTSWTMSQAKQILNRFLPPDSKPVTTMPIDATIEYIFQSDSLAATFPPSEFHDGQVTPQQVPPGTYSYSCNAGTRFDNCDISTGIV